jgi:translation elongation factor EF-Tu-like GTPase
VREALRMPDSADGTFEVVVENVYRLPGRGTAVVGQQPEAGTLHNGDAVHIIRDGQVRGDATAYVELHSRPGQVSLLIPDQDADVQPGDLIRHRPTG